MKLEEASWDMAKKLVQEGIMVGMKKCKVELWGQTNRATNKRRTGSFPSPPTQGVQNPQRDHGAEIPQAEASGVTTVAKEAT